MNAQPTTFAVFHHRAFMGYVNAPSHAKAVERATALYGRRVEVELSTTRTTRQPARIAANKVYNAKRAAPYPTDGFDARRAALIAEFKAGE